MRLPIDVRDVTATGSRLREDRERPVRIVVLVDRDAPEPVLDALEAALVPRTASARLHIEAVDPDAVLVVDSHADAVVAVVGSGDELAASLAAARDRYVPAVAIALGDSRDAVARRLGHPTADTLVVDSGEQAVEALGSWLVDRLSHKKLALAANFAFVQRAVAEEAVKTTAMQNAAIGAIAVIPGADMPLMTANQLKMVLQIAAAYGEPLGAERIKELAAVVGGAFVFRTVARQFVGLVPGFGWAIKGGIGYSATLAMGYAAIEYFEAGGDVGGLAQRVAEARDRVLKRAPEAPIPGHAAVVEPDQTSEPTVPQPALPTGQGADAQ